MKKTLIILFSTIICIQAQNVAINETGLAPQAQNHKLPHILYENSDK